MYVTFEGQRMKFGAKTIERLEASIFVTETTSTAVNICRNLFIKFEKYVKNGQKVLKLSQVSNL